MVLSFTERAKMLWNAWNVRGLIILSLSLQAFLILFARLRKGRFGRNFFIRWSIWLAYLTADWVATYTIGLIFSSNIKTSTSSGPPADILVFWASFLLLHLGGPENITSYALEDNELWKRHLLGLLLQVVSTLYAFLNSFSKNKLWLPTILVLFVGIIKYAERTIAFYLASFDHFGEDWVSTNVEMGDDERRGETGTGLPIPAQFQGMEDHKSDLGTAVQLFGNLKRALVGPLLKVEEQARIRQKFLEIKRSHVGLLVFKIELSLLYELLHTKLPVIDSKSGFTLRVPNISCILLALVLFSLAKRHYQLGEFDMLLTYGLLIGALALDFLSISLLRHSDWFAISHFQESNEKKVIERQKRWSNEVSQLNFITYHIKDMPVWLKKLAAIFLLRSLLTHIKGIRCQSSQNFESNRTWHFIYYQLKHLAKESTRINEVWLGRGKKILKEILKVEQQEMIDTLDYTQSLLVWHIATELCYQKDVQNEPDSSTDYRPVCKLLSDYMFYLAVMQPTMMAPVLDNWRTVFKKISKTIQSEVPWSFFSNEKDVSGIILDIKEREEKDKDDEEVKISLFSAVQLARGFKLQDNHYPWRKMSQIWVELMCYAAINCRPNVHAQQLSQGGELLTLVWLMMNHLGLGTKNYVTLSDVRGDSESDEPEDDYGA